MPDGDVIPRSPVRLWKKPHRMLSSGADAEDVAGCISDALMASLREKGGLPGAHDLAAVVGALVDGNIGLSEAIAESREVEWRCDAHLHTRLAGEATRRLLVEIAQGKVAVAEPLATVAEESCKQLIRYHLLGRIGPDQQGVYYSTHDDYLGWERSVLAPVESKIAAIAADLAHDPTGRSLPRRGPATKARRPQTAAILESDLLGIR